MFTQTQRPPLHFRLQQLPVLRQRWPSVRHPLTSWLWVPGLLASAMPGMTELMAATATATIAERRDRVDPTVRAKELNCS